MNNPATCIPPDPSVSGWYEVDDNSDFRALLYWSAPVQVWTHPTRYISGQEADGFGWSVIGPVTLFADVEALRAENAALKSILIRAAGQFEFYADQNFVKSPPDIPKQKTNIHWGQLCRSAVGCNPDLPRPDLVTILRKDLQFVLRFAGSSDAQSVVDERIAKMEADANART